MFKKLIRRLSKPLRRNRMTVAERDAAHVAALRKKGVRIGEGCRIYTSAFSTEPWLVRIGDRVGIAGGVKFLTHDGSAHLIRQDRPMAQKFGTITVGNDVFIGESAIILPGTAIGDGCIVGPGAVVRGEVPPHSIVYGNPAQIVGRASLYLARLKASPDTLDSFGLPEAERRQMIEAHFGMGN